jgi:pyridoxamine 5'-phosphate oxidase
MQRVKETFVQSLCTEFSTRFRIPESMSNALETPPSNPFALYNEWAREAENKEPNDPNAAALATAAPDGIPSVRMVLVKHATADGFWFFTNAESEKGVQLKANPHAALCFHWKTLRRQVRVSGSIQELSAQQTDEYFHSRSRRSQIGAAVSHQSRPLPSRAVLEQAVQKYTEDHPGEIPRPAYWQGFCIHPERVEFWADGPDRLHDRVVYRRSGQNRQSGQEWTVERLWP